MPDSTQIRALFDGLGDGIFLADSLGRYVDVNPAGCRMLGYDSDELIGMSVADVVDPSELERLVATMAEMADLSLHRSEWLFRRKDNSTFVGELVGGQRPDGMLQSVVRDVTERLARERMEQILRREAAHRTKNVLAVVKALLRLSNSNDVAEFKHVFGQRIHALAAGHDLFIGSEWSEIDLADLIQSQMKPFERGNNRIDLSGPKVMVGPAAAQAIGMSVHELGTNAAKYGSLSVEGGRLEVSWRFVETGTSRQFEMCWQELDGPPVAAPEHRGFGTVTMVRMAEIALQGKVGITFGEQGLRWTLTCPVALLGSS